MNRPPEYSPQSEERAVPRWVYVPLGIVLGALAFLCLAGSIMIIFLPDKKNPDPILAPALGAGMILVSLWALSVCYRMVVGKKVRGGLLGPRALRVIAWVFLSLPITGLLVGLFTGDFTNLLQGLVMSVVYVGAFFRLRSLAARRERNDV